MKHLITRYLQDRSGATAVEYGLITALISAALIGGAMTLGDTINNTMDGAAQHLKNSQ